MNRLWTLSTLSAFALVLSACAGAASLVAAPTASPTSTATTTPTATRRPIPTATATPEKPCSITSLTAVTGEIPSFQIEAAGFAPNEGRMITISGEITAGGQPQTFMTTLAGSGGESADAQGRISQFAAFMHESQLALFRQATQIEFQPQQVTITILGKQSKCEVTATVDWP